MNEEFEFEIHEYTFIPYSRELKYRSHKTRNVKKTIKESRASRSNETKVFLILNGVENEEEAYIFEKRMMMRVFSYEAIRAVELIAGLPFYQYSNDSLIIQLTESLYTRFFRSDEPDPFF